MTDSTSTSDPTVPAETSTVGRARIRVVAPEAETLFVFCHPSQSYLDTFLTEALTWAGAGVVGVDGRYVEEGDADLDFELAAEDVARAVREVVPADKPLVLVGHSGGAPLAALIQTRYRLARALVFLAPHPSRAEILGNWIDPSLREDGTRDPELDLYAEGRKPPFSEEFIERYRQAQRDRIETIAATAAACLARGEPESKLPIPGAFADPRFVDRTLDPNQRRTLPFGQEPRVLNNTSGFLADGCTARSFFEQWYPPTTSANLLGLARWLTVPVLSVAFGADPIIFPSQTLQVATALPRGSTVWTLEGAVHDPREQKDHLDALARKMLAWLPD